MEYNKLSDEIIAKLQALVGVQNVVTDAGQMEIYSHDEVTDPAYHHMPGSTVFNRAVAAGIGCHIAADKTGIPAA